MSRKLIVLSVALLSGLAIVLSAAIPTLAQGPNPQPPNAPMLAPMFGLVCSTTDYTDVAAKALGITASDLRLALVSGKTLEDLATSKNVTLQTVTDALAKARQADIEQAAKDGLIPQQMADMMGQRMNPSANRGQPDNAQPGAQPGTPPAPSAGQGPIRRTVRIMAFAGAGFGISAHNEVRPFVAAAQSIGTSCADLVKAMAGSKSIVQVATEKNVQVQTVVDAVVKAYKDALAQDVKEGLITQAQADAQNIRLVERVTAMISNRGAMMGRMGGFGGVVGRLFGRMFGGNDNGNGDGNGQGNRPGGFGFGGRGNRPGGNPSNPQPNAPATPQAAPTQAS